MKQHIIDLLARHLGERLSREEIGRLIEVPPSETLAILPFHAFRLHVFFVKVLLLSPRS